MKKQHSQGVVDESKRRAGVVDEPEFREEGQGKDGLELTAYYEALAEFIRETETPMTVGIQGKWGSGKTTLMNHIWKELKGYEQIGPEQGESASGGTAGAQALKSHDEYMNIWVNSWEHALMASPEETLLRIVHYVTSEILAFDENANQKWKEIQTTFGKLAKGGLRMVAGATVGLAGAEVVKEFTEKKPDNSIRELRTKLQEIINSISNNGTERFVIYIDDLDRLEPKIAVRILELLKNVFSLNHCVFVLAIDYEVVVKGLKLKYGEKSDVNDEEYRKFFDKIIQLPFEMPSEAGGIASYVMELLSRINYELVGNSDADTIRKVLQCTIGGNPRSIKRMVNALSLINKIADKLHKDEAEAIDPEDRLPLFALVCCQIEYPYIYKTLKEKPNFEEEWGQEFVEEQLLGKDIDQVKVDQACAAVKTNKLFNDDWEQSLFKICYIQEELRPRAPQISQFLNMFTGVTDDEVSGDEIRFELDGEKFEELLRISAVTGVASKSTRTTTDVQEWKTREDKNKTKELWSRIYESINQAHPDTLFKKPSDDKIQVSGRIQKNSKQNRAAKYVLHLTPSINLVFSRGDKKTNKVNYDHLKNKKKKVLETLKCKESDLMWDDNKPGKTRILSLKANDELVSKIAKGRKDSNEKTPIEETWGELQEFFAQNIKQFEQLENVMRKSQKK